MNTRIEEHVLHPLAGPRLSVLLAILAAASIVAFSSAAHASTARPSLTDALMHPLLPLRIMSGLEAADNQLVHHDAHDAAKQLATVKGQLDRYALAGAYQSGEDLLDARLTLQLAEREAHNGKVAAARTNLFKTKVKLENALGLSGSDANVVAAVNKAVDSVAQMFEPRSTGTNMLEEIWKTVTRWLVPQKK